MRKRRAAEARKAAKAGYQPAIDALAAIAAAKARKELAQADYAVARKVAKLDPAFRMLGGLCSGQQKAYRLQGEYHQAIARVKASESAFSDLVGPYSFWRKESV
jgi:uncharacterized protein HemY